MRVQSWIIKNKSRNEFKNESMNHTDTVALFMSYVQTSREKERKESE